MRYLGYIAKKCEKIPFFVQILEQEMLCRTLKIEFNELLRNTKSEKLSQVITKYLNSYFGKNSFSNEKSLKKQINEKFKYLFENFVVFQNSKTKLSTLRNFCIKVGLKILLKDYNFDSDSPFEVSDILSLEPKIKHSLPVCSTAKNLLEVGKQQLTMNQFESSFEFLSQSIVMFQQVKGPMNQDVSNCFSSLATILFNASDLPQSLLHQHKALLISKRVFGFDSHITSNLYQYIGVLAHHLGIFFITPGQSSFALKYFMRSLYIINTICGFDHPDLPNILSNIAMMYQDYGDTQTSLKYMKQSLDINERIFGKNSVQSAQNQHSIAMCHYLTEKFKLSLIHEKLNYKILENLYGKEDQRVKESSNWLEHITSKAVNFETNKNKKEIKENEVKENFNEVFNEEKFQQEFLELLTKKPKENYVLFSLKDHNSNLKF
jgi:protein TIF31